jgi:hypothetical protein
MFLCTWRRLWIFNRGKTHGSSSSSVSLPGKGDWRSERCRDWEMGVWRGHLRRRWMEMCVCVVRNKAPCASSAKAWGLVLIETQTSENLNKSKISFLETSLILLVYLVSLC